MKSIQLSLSFFQTDVLRGKRVKSVLSLFAIPCLMLGSVSTLQAQEMAEGGEKYNFIDHVLPIFRSKCGSCHNANDARGGLTVDNYVALMAGGSSGEVIEIGESDNSYLYSLITHASEPRMPPSADKLPDNELAIIAKWIDQGAPEKSDSKVVVKKRKTIARVEAANERPSEVAMPENYYGDPLLVPRKMDAINALAVSPWASIGAASGHQQVALFDTTTLDSFGVLQFPEGTPRIIKFSRDGSLVLVGGGRGGLNGRVVVYDVKTGERRIEVGDEYDQVLAADISADLTRIALGGPKKMLRVYDTDTGEMISESKKHTDWITSIEFSPDSVLLASGDRSNGLVIWEAPTGNLFYDLQGHRGAITDISWRSDSNVVASASEDRTVKLWEMQNGTQFKSWEAHGGGVTALEYTRDGHLVSTGRDQIPRMWNGEGAKVRDYPATSSVGMSIAFDSEVNRLLVGEWAGKITVYNANDAVVLATVTRNPQPLPVQLDELESELAGLQTALQSQQAEVDLLNSQLAQRQQLAATAEQTVVAKQAELTAATDAVTAQQAKHQAAVASKDQLEATLNQARTAQTEAANALQMGEEAIRNAQIALNKTGETATQAANLEQKLSTDFFMAKTQADEATKAAQPTEAETAAAATDEAVRQALTERENVAKAAQAKANELEAALAKAKEAALQARQTADSNAKLLVSTTEKEKQLNSLHQQAVQASTEAEKAYNSAITEVTAAQTSLYDANALMAKQQTELTTAQAASEQAAAQAQLSEEEAKILAEKQAVVTGTQERVSAVNASIERLKGFQSSAKTASVEL